MGKQESMGDWFQMAKDYAKAEMNRKRFGERPLFRFVIKGHEIEACSRKDAIAKLKHKGLI